MTTFNTGNPIGSTDARDRSDNSENLDLAVNSLALTFEDRLGVTRDTLEGIYQKSAYYRAGTFDAGYTLTNNRQTLAYGNVEYSWSGAFPKVVVAGATPATSGGIGAVAWVDRTDSTLRSDLLAGSGELVQYLPFGLNAISRSMRSKLGESISVADFGAVGDGTTDDSVAIQNAINVASTIGLGRVYFPYTINGYYIASSLTAKNIVKLYSDHYTSAHILTKSDIEAIKSDSSTLNSQIWNFEISDMAIWNMVTGPRTKYDIHLTNPNFCRLHRVRVRSWHDDNVYSSTNTGGVFFDKPTGSTATAFCNLLSDCWMQNNQAVFKQITDSNISGGYYWGHVRDSAIKMSDCGNMEIAHVQGIICSQYKGGIYITGASSLINQVRIIGNEFDGNPLLIRGAGIFADVSVEACVISGNMIWGCGNEGIVAYDPVGWSITGNSFWRCNDNDNYKNDISFIGVGIQPNANVVSGNTHVMDVARTKPGYAIAELNSGNYCKGNTFTNNAISGNYINPSISLSLLQGEESYCWGNNGVGSEKLQITKQIYVTERAKVKTKDVSVLPVNGTMDLVINPIIGEGFAGLLVVTATRSNFTQQSKKTLYSAFGIGTAITLTQISTLDGSGGASAFTVAAYGQGTIRVTNTGLDVAHITAQFFGGTTIG